MASGEGFSPRHPPDPRAPLVQAQVLDTSTDYLSRFEFVTACQALLANGPRSGDGGEAVSSGDLHDLFNVLDPKGTGFAPMEGFAALLRRNAQRGVQQDAVKSAAMQRQVASMDQPQPPPALSAAQAQAQATVPMSDSAQLQEKISRMRELLQGTPATGTQLQEAFRLMQMHGANIARQLATYPKFIRREQLAELLPPQLSLQHQGDLINLLEATSAQYLQGPDQPNCMRRNTILACCGPYDEHILEIVVKAVRGLTEEWGIPLDGARAYSLRYQCWGTDCSAETSLFVPSDSGAGLDFSAMHVFGLSPQDNLRELFVPDEEQNSSRADAVTIQAFSGEPHRPRRLVATASLPGLDLGAWLGACVQEASTQKVTKEWSVPLYIATSPSSKPQTVGTRRRCGEVFLGLEYKIHRNRTLPGPFPWRTSFEGARTSWQEDGVNRCARPEAFLPEKPLQPLQSDAPPLPAPEMTLGKECAGGSMPSAASPRRSRDGSVGAVVTLSVQHALHLPKLMGRPPSTYVVYSWLHEDIGACTKIGQTEVVHNTSCPDWDHSSVATLPDPVIVGDRKVPYPEAFGKLAVRLEVWHAGLQTAATLVGAAEISLAPLLSGFSEVDGYFHIIPPSSFGSRIKGADASCGQIRAGVMPKTSTLLSSRLQRSQTSLSPRRAGSDMYVGSGVSPGPQRELWQSYPSPRAVRDPKAAATPPLRDVRGVQDDMNETALRLASKVSVMESDLRSLGGDEEEQLEKLRLRHRENLAALDRLQNGLLPPIGGYRPERAPAPTPAYVDGVGCAGSSLGERLPPYSALSPRSPRTGLYPAAAGAEP
eukprot:CAMPEP_0178388744 /NCGR_PEP_ID=MMETSP0689_2-20121128/9752_1 /TAXON_ID=160604 /ORGANISM="Amphidinium massartii, Strain CS-259" /LENGTH=822 /DNA_ID=CAMNT_0020009159 /DNA_START=22 /DNA_END=2486 /DNA_ORIENTATION=+